MLAGISDRLRGGAERLRRVGVGVVVALISLSSTAFRVRARFGMLAAQPGLTSPSYAKTSRTDFSVSLDLPLASKR